MAVLREGEEEMLQDYIADEPEIGQYLHGAMQFPPSHLDPAVWGDTVAGPPCWGIGRYAGLYALVCVCMYRER